MHPALSISQASSRFSKAATAAPHRNSVALRLGSKNKNKNQRLGRDTPLRVARQKPLVFCNREKANRAVAPPTAARSIGSATETAGQDSPLVFQRGILSVFNVKRREVPNVLAPAERIGTEGP